MIETKFKNTEIGPIPVDWEVKTLGDFCAINGRIGFRGYTIADIVDEGFGAITLSPSNMKFGRMDYSNCKFISWEKYEESPEIKIYNGDVLLVKTGSTYGKVAYVSSLPHKATINPQIVVLKNIKGNSYLISLLLQSPSFASQIDGIVNGGAIPTMKQSSLLECKIAYPPLAEQEAIGEALREVDELIEGLKKLVAKKRAIKQGAMSQLLSGISRLPGFGNNKYKNTEIGVIPEDWSTCYLKEVTAIKSGDSIVGDSFELNGKYPVYGGNGIRGFIGHYNLNGEYILIGRVGALCGNIHVAKGKVFASEHALICFPLKEFNAEYIALILKTMNLGQYSGASAQPVLAAKKISELPILFPSLAEQEAIAKVLTDMDAEIEALSRKVTKYEQVKQGMMQQLLTGKIRLV